MDYLLLIGFLVQLQKFQNCKDRMMNANADAKIV